MEMNPKKVYIAAAVLVVVGLGKLCAGEEGQGHIAWVDPKEVLTAAAGLVAVAADTTHVSMLQGLRCTGNMCTGKGGLGSTYQG